jgi:two-component system, LuxR family, response regulator FixJ
MLSPATRARVVIVEDDAPLLEALAFALRAARYEVKAYRTALRALADRSPCDCLIVDLRLPDLDGLTLIDQLRGSGVQAPAILITTNPDERSRKRSSDAGVPIVEKPLIGGNLGREIEVALAGRTGL